MLTLVLIKVHGTVNWCLWALWNWEALWPRGKVLLQRKRHVYAVPLCLMHLRSRFFLKIWNMPNVQSDEGTSSFTKSIRQLTSQSSPASHTARKHPLQRHHLKSSVSPIKACWLHNLLNNPVPSLQDVNHHHGIDLQWVAFEINIWINVVSIPGHTLYSSRNACLLTVGKVQDQRTAVFYKPELLISQMCYSSWSNSSLLLH